MLRLDMFDYVGPTNWRWRLTDDGTPLVEHAVELDDQDWQFAAFADLHGYLRAHAEPERRLAHEALLVGQLGDWLAEHALGPVATHLAQAGVPVLLTVPAEAAALAYRPWELATIDDRPLVAHRVGFVVDEPHPAGDKHDVGARLRMLAVFGVPADDDALTLRKQVFALARAMHQISVVHDRAIELRVLQYGTTRQQLADVLREDDGWDVVHVSGHRLPAGLALTDESGHPDVVDLAELADLLEPATSRLKLVTLSTSESATVTATVEMQHLGMLPPDVIPPDADTGHDSLPEVGRMFVRRLGCVALAMRFPVVDDFAAALAESFYSHALGSGRPIAEAAALSITQVAGGLPTNSIPPRSVATAALIGSRAQLRLALPPGDPQVYRVERQRLAEFPTRPERFVGRVRQLARVAEVLTERDARPGVVLHGMAGIGKTACALELAYGHQESFTTLAWYGAPAEGRATTTALTDFATVLERHLPGLPLARCATDPAAWQEIMPALTESLERTRALVVLDGVESLLTEDGEWADERWAHLVRALTGHHGRSRVIVTSRLRPAGLPDTVLDEPVRPLSVNETVLLTRQLPRLCASMDGLVPDLTIDQAHEVAARTITIVQGHPKLLELAEGIVGYPEDLVTELFEADRQWREHGTRLVAFLSGDEPDLTPENYLALLAAWTRAATDALPEETKALVAFLSCLDPADRFSTLIHALWPEVWRRLGHDGDGPHPDMAAVPAVHQCLISVDSALDTGRPVGYRIHPAVAEVGREIAGPEFAELLDNAAANAWLATLREAERQGTPPGTANWVLHAVRSAAPYLIRRQRWTHLLSAAHEALARDYSTATAVALLPILSTIVEATMHTEGELPAGRVHAQAVAAVDLGRGATELRALLDSAVAKEDFAQASVTAGDLIRVYLATGKLAEALAVAEVKTGHTAKAGLGPWTRLADEGQRLQIMRMLGRHQDVLAGVTGLRETMATLPEKSDVREAVAPSTIREMTLNLGVLTATDLGLWEQALELNAALRQSLRDRGADDVEQAQTGFNDSGPLLRLGRGIEARDLLAECQQVFEAAENLPMIGKTLSARAEVEGELGHVDRTITFETEALRLKYTIGDPESIAVSHHNLTHYLIYIEAQLTPIWAHCLAAAVIRYQIDSPNLIEAIQAIGRLLPPDEVPEGMPSFDQVCAIVDHQEGIQLRKLAARLPQRAESGQAAVEEVVRQALDMRATAIREAVTAWEPIVSAVLAAEDSSNETPVRVLNDTLAALRTEPVWKELAAVVRRIHLGEHDRTLARHLSPADAAITRRTLDALDGTVEVDPNAWRTLIET